MISVNLGNIENRTHNLHVNIGSQLFEKPHAMNRPVIARPAITDIPIQSIPPRCTLQKMKGDLCKCAGPLHLNWLNYTSNNIFFAQNSR